MSNHWVPFYFGDYIRDTRTLTPLEHGVFILLLTENWQGRAIESLDDAYRIVGAFVEEERQAIARVIAKLFEQKDDGFWNKKAREIIKAQTEKRRKLSENGRRGGLAKARILPEQKSGIPKSESKSNINNPPTPKGACEGFEKFWAEYPKRVKKSKALATWKARKLEAIAGNVVDAVKRYKLTDDWKKENGRYIPHPTSFLNAGQWEDEINTGAVKPASLWQRIQAAGSAVNVYDGSEIDLSEWRYEPKGYNGYDEALVRDGVIVRLKDYKPVWVKA